jgi:galactokinase
MDQFASAFGVENHALFLDCRSLDWSPIPLSNAKFIICNTKTKHDLADGEYNKRRADCEEAARLLGHESLRNIAWEEFSEKAENLPKGDLPEFGALMDASHESLSADYEVSSAELDLMVRIVRSQRGVLGARMTGGGFGGCTVNLLDAEATDEFVETVISEYHGTTGITPEIYVCKASAGVAEL